MQDYEITIVDDSVPGRNGRRPDEVTLTARGSLPGHEATGTRPSSATSGGNHRRGRLEAQLVPVGRRPPGRIRQGAEDRDETRRGQKQGLVSKLDFILMFARNAGANTFSDGEVC